MPRGRLSREIRSTSVTEADVAIPNKLYFRIGEVSELAQTKPYVLRYWESEFPTLRPVKSKSGHRLYRRQDVEMVLQIKRLLYEHGYTIEGARKELANHSGERLDQEPLFRPVAASSSTELKAIRRELQSILTILSRKW
jgi:DNA-binding transcriptional MerR regulator